jgi:hypothetical protein
MKHTLKTLVMAVVALVTVLFCNTPNAGAATLIDTASFSAPTPGPNDIYMTDESAPPVEPPGINYYSNGSGPGNPGQIFTTGSNPSGYTLNSVAFLTGGNSGDNIQTVGQTWYLRLYSYNPATSNATFITTYPSQNNFTFFEFDWLQFTNLGAGLSPNTTYAYTIQNGGAGWEQLDGENTSALVGVFTNGQCVLIPTGGGQLAANCFATGAPAWQEDFSVGLTPISGLVVNPPVLATPGNIYPTPQNAYATNTAVTINCGAVLGSGPLTFQWQTDGGSGGALTNIPGITTSNATVNLPSTLGTYQFDVIVSNSTTSVTSSVVNLRVALPTVAASLVDEGSSFVPAAFAYTISQVTYATNLPDTAGDGLNYYDNNPSQAGQTFTTGTNAQGYVLTSVQIMTDPISNEAGDGTGQPYYLYIYSVNTNTAVGQIIQVYTNSSFTFNLGDWLVWSGLSTTLKSNSVYAYAFGNNLSYYYAGLNASRTNNYQGGQLCIINPVEGSISFDGTDPTTNNSAVFYLTFTTVGQADPHATASAIAVTPTSGLVGTTFNLSETAGGQSPFGYYWYTDGGSGGAVTNIPGNNQSNLVLNTTGWNPGVYSYKVVVSNALNTATSSVVSVPVTLASVSTNGVLVDIGINPPTPGPLDIYQTNEVTGHSFSAGNLNYYFDNANPPGETFITGGNAGGYVLNTLAVELGGDDAYVTPDFPAGGQGYVVNIYRIYNDQSGKYASLYATYASQTNFVISRGTVATENDTDWLQMTNMSLSLQPNTAYAYSFGKAPGAAGYESMGNIQSTNTPDYYPNGQAALLPGSSGQVAFANTSGWDAIFDLGLSLGTVPASIQIQRTGSQVTLTWTGSALLQSTAVNGPWTTNLNSSPYTFTPTGKMFYRAQQ